MGSSRSMLAESARAARSTVQSVAAAPIAPDFILRSTTAAAVGSVDGRWVKLTHYRALQ
jgi:hypothetical protein